MITDVHQSRLGGLRSVSFLWALKTSKIGLAILLLLPLEAAGAFSLGMLFSSLVSGSSDLLLGLRTKFMGSGWRS